MIDAADVEPFLTLVRSAVALERGAPPSLVSFEPVALCGERLRRAVTVNGLVPLMARWRDELLAAAEDREWLRREQAKNAVRMLGIANTAIVMQAQLDTAGVRALILKGAPLAARTTGSLTGRQFSDIDVLVHVDEIERAGEVLEGIGIAHAESAHDSPVHGPYHRWIRWTANHCQYRSADGTPVELHWRLFHNDLLPLDFETLWRQHTTVPIADRSLRTLGPAHELLFVSAHAVKHSFMRLQWLVDVVRVLRMASTNTWEEVTDLAVESGATRALALAVQWAGRIEPNHRDVPLRPGDRRRVAKLAEEVRPATGGVLSHGDHLRFALRLRRDPHYLMKVIAHVAVPAGLLDSVKGPPPLAYLSLPLRRLTSPRDFRRSAVQPH